MALVFCHKHTHTHMARIAVNTHPFCLCHKQNTSVITANTSTDPLRLLLHRQARCQSPGVGAPLPGQRAATPAGRRLCQCGTISQAATGKRQHTHTHTLKERGSFLHLQRMIIHDYGVFQKLKTWPGSMHHSISTVPSLVRLNPSVNHSDHLSRGGDRG